MAQVGKDYYEDLTPEGFAGLIDAMAAGEVPLPGPQNGRYACEPASGLTSLTDFESGRARHNASVQLAADHGDTIKRIDGSEVPLTAPWHDLGARHDPAPSSVTLNDEPVEITAKGAKADAPAAATPPVSAKPAPARSEAKKAEAAPAEATRPEALDGPRGGKPDDLKKIKGVGPKLEKLVNELGFYHFDQIAKWTEAEIAWVDENLKGFKGRVSRDTWVEQAKLLAEGKETEFSTRVKKGGVY